MKEGCPARLALNSVPQATLVPDPQTGLILPPRSISYPHPPSSVGQPAWEGRAALPAGKLSRASPRSRLTALFL